MFHLRFGKCSPGIIQRGVQEKLSSKCCDSEYRFCIDTAGSHYMKKYPSSVFSHILVRFSIIRSKMFILYVVITILDRDTNCFLKTISIYIWLYISRPVYKHSIFYKRYITMLQEDIISLASFIRHRLLCKASYVCHAFII